jgi:hypothetical protein
MCRSSVKTTVATTAVLLSAFVATADDIRLDVTGGKADVEGWVAEATLDLATAARLLGWPGKPDQIAIIEYAGRRAKPVQHQVDRATGDDMYTVSWRIPGTLAASQTRRFLLRFDTSPVIGTPGTAIDVATSANTLVVNNGDITLEHQREIGGFISRVTVAEATGALSWHDKVYDGTAYYLPTHEAERMEVTAAGPLRVVIEAASVYLGVNGEQPPSKPRAVYRFTNYAGLPITVVEALVTQEFAQQWKSLHFIEMGTGGAGFTNIATDGRGASLEQTGRFIAGAKWGAVYNGQLLIAMCTATQPGAYDGGGGKHYLQYLRSGTASMTTLAYRWKDAIFWGPGGQALEDRTVQRWHEILAAPPTVQIHFSTLATRLEAVTRIVNAKERALDELSGKDWAVAHVGMTLARGGAAAAGKKIAGGSFRETLSAIESCEQALNANSSEAELAQTGSGLAGVVLGHPYLGNDKAVYLFARPEHGAGLMSIYDRAGSRELLSIDPVHATLWEATVKTEAGGASFANNAQPCTVTFNTDAAGGQLLFEWSEHAAVDVVLRLGAGEALLRGRIEATIDEDKPSGFVSVAFPVVKGIKPLSPGSQRDTILDTGRFGRERPSPLLSSKVHNIECPPGMQFTALTGDGLGFYFGEEDGLASRKQLSWAAAGDLLNFSIVHAVLGWGGDRPVRTYRSPGHVVLGPFRGDWYDAARIYRKWAITAPWCAKGRIHERADYPKWLIKAPYWSIGYLQHEKDIEDELNKQAFYEIPTMVAHIYNYFFTRHLDDRYPEYFPPKLGSAGFTAAIERLQSNGVRVVPYVNGSMWDMDTDSYRMEDAERRGAIWMSADGNLNTTTSYGGGSSLATMCPGSAIWREKLSAITSELVGRYGADGVYFDFLTDHNGDCYNPEHGHPICGGNFWAKAVHDLYAGARATAKEHNPEAMITGEGIGEFCIDVHDTFLSLGESGSSAPLFLAVYHGYTNVYGGIYNKVDPIMLGRWWLMGCQNGWHGTELGMAGVTGFNLSANSPPERRAAFLSSGKFYKSLLQCRWRFATPYLGYGEMLKPPTVEGDIPTVSRKDMHGPFTVSLVEGSAWQAPDGTIGVFFLNYDKENAYDFTWTIDRAETPMRMSRWSEAGGLTLLKDTAQLRIEPLGLIALKLEVLQ